MYLNDQELYSISADQDADIRIVLFDKNTMEALDVVSFSYDTRADMDDNAIIITEVSRP